MSSLLKMNQKFLSKSSWTIRGNGTNSNQQSPAGSGSGSSNTPNRQNTGGGANNSKFGVFSHSANRTGKPFTNSNDKAQSVDGKRHPQHRQPQQHQQYYSSNTDRQQFEHCQPYDGGHQNGGVTGRTPVKAANYRQQAPNRQLVNHHTDIDRQITDTGNHSNYNSNYNNRGYNSNFDDLNQHRPSSGFGGLRRTKGMSHSITDLRELKEKPPPRRDSDEDEAFQREIFERRIDTYIAEIEMDPLFHLGSTIRAIYDGDEQDRFMEKLDARIKNHDKDIERMCNCHYQGFVDCIHELLKVRPQATALKSEIHQVNNELKNSSENIVRKAEELIKYRRVLCNTKVAIEHLQECLPVLETFSRLMNQMSEKKYYPALKTLEQFETLYLPKFKKYRFAQSMCNQVPKIRETITNESVKDLKDFLENIRQSTSKIGEIALRNTALSHQSTDYVKTLYESDQIWRDKSRKYSILDKTNEKTADKNPFGDEEEIEGGEELVFGVANSDELSAPDIVDFSPVYRCLHIFGCLGSREQFEHYYRIQRKQQARLIFQFNASNSSLFTGVGFRNYLFSVVGFFVIEDHLLNTSNGLVTKQYLAENWDEVIKALVKNVQEHASECKDSKQMIVLKSLLMVFCHTVHSYGYCTDEIIKLLGDLRQIYIDILQADWLETFEGIFKADNYHPLLVDSEEEFRQIFEGFPLSSMVSLRNDPELGLGAGSGKIDYPRRFPFSSMVTNIYKAVREFIVRAIEFSNDLNVTLTDTEDMVRSSTNLLLTKTLSDALQTLIKKSKLGLGQLIQMSINLNYLEEASTYLKTHINEQIQTQSSDSVSNSKEENGSLSSEPTPGQAPVSGQQQQRGDTSTTTSVGLSSGPKKFLDSEPLSHTYLTELKGETMFAEARADAEAQIYKQLQRKVEEFFDLANYDFLMTEQLSGKASPYILDLIAFLRSTFEAFTNLPPRVAQTACLSSSKFISSKLLDILKDENVKAFSQQFLEQFNLDLVQCEMYSASEPVPNFSEGLADCFKTLRQVMDLMIVDTNWSTYFADYGKDESEFLRVPAHLALGLLEKQIRGEQKKGVFSALSKNERDKKSRNDMIVKKLRELIEKNSNANQ